MFGKRIQLTELDSQIRELERKREKITTEINQRISYSQFACCKKCKHPLIPVEQKTEYSEVEKILNKHDLECKDVSTTSDYLCSQCNRDLKTGSIQVNTAYRFGDKLYCADCARVKQINEK